MYLTGFADEAAADLAGQIAATRELGWRHIEARAIDGTNITTISDAEFERARAALAAAGITVNCFGSGVANWACRIDQPPDSSYAEMRRALPRMAKLGTKLIRVMSFAVPPEKLDRDWSTEAISRMKVIAGMAADAGVTCVHENCSGWGALSAEHTLRLLEGVDSPALKLVFDTGNPVFHDDVRGPGPWRKQDAWEFYRAVREHIVYVHIKDGRWENGQETYTFPGEGDGAVRRVLTDLLQAGYDGGISIEPHMAVVYHDKSVQADAAARRRNYVEYGRRVEKILAGIRAG